MKKLILNKPIRTSNGEIDYKEVINNNPRLKNLFPISQPKSFLEGLLGDKYAPMAAAAQRALEIPPFCELFIHEVLLPKHLIDGCGMTELLAYRLASKMNDLYLARPYFTANTKAIESEVSDEEFAVLNHLISTYSGDHADEYKVAWQEMISSLSND